jgi:hypothetical protein
MHHIDQLLKQKEVAWIGSYTCSDQDAVEPLLLELALDHCLRSLAEVGHAHLHLISETSQFVLGGLETGQHFRCIHAGWVAGF